MVFATRRLNQISPQLWLYFAAIACLGVANGTFQTSYNNFLDTVFHIDAQTRGMLELPREMPGFLVAFMTGLLAFLPETRVAAISGLVTFMGMGGLGLVDWGIFQQHQWQWMVGATVLWAIGTHLIMPVRASIGMSLAHHTRHGRRLGQMSAIGAAATIIGASFAWVVSSGRLVPPFGLIFVTGAGATLVAAVLFWRMRDIGRQTKRPRLIVRRRYWLYYVLCLLFGARKQMFVTFGPWVLIKVFNRQVSTFAKLGIISSLLTVFTNPMIGNLIDRWGERKILVVDSLVLLLICLGYGGAHWLGPSGVYLVFLCFIMDDVMFGVGNARSTYLAKIAEKPEHVTASLSLGVSLDHAVSMSLPTLGGYVWVHYGHSWVFFGAGAIALLMMIFSALIKLPQAPAAASGEAVGSASAAE